MDTYLYDSSFDGLITVIDYLLREKITPNNIVIESEYQPEFFAGKINIKTETQQAENFLVKLRKTIPVKSISDLFYAYLSELPGMEMNIYHYIRLGMKYKKRLGSNLREQTVLTIRKTARKVGGEAHRLKGLLRFRELADGTLYAPFEPDHRVIHILSNHFRQRLSAEKWVIHDIRRNIGIFYQNGDCNEFMIESAPDVHHPDENTLSQRENEFQELWKTFYYHVGIKGRINHPLRRQFMPKKYWKYLIEVD